jgi:hypothetical protein
MEWLSKRINPERRYDPFEGDRLFPFLLSLFMLETVQRNPVLHGRQGCAGKQ